MQELNASVYFCFVFHVPTSAFLLPVLFLSTSVAVSGMLIMCACALLIPFRLTSSKEKDQKASLCQRKSMMANNVVRVVSSAVSSGNYIKVGRLLDPVRAPIIL